MAEGKISLPLDASDAYTNTAASRSFDLTSHIIRLSIQFDVSSKNPSNKDYIFAIPSSWQPYVANMKVSIDKKEYKDGLSVNRDESKGVTFISAPAAETFKLSSFKAKLDIILIKAFSPLPASIAQGENQSVVFSLPDDVVAIITPYATQTQVTSLSLPSKTKIQRRTQNPKPNTVSGNIVKYGPYTDKDVSSALTTPLSCHFEFNNPMFVFTNVLREYEVSHWGNCAVEDHYDLVHTGAQLSGGFSRGLYTQTRNDAGGPSFRTLKATLPLQASDIYYRDVIGNISTSQVKYQRTITELEIEARYPIFGGWKTSWYQGYNVPLSTVASYDDKSGKYSLKLPLGIPFDNTVAENLKIKIVLPQFSSNIKYETNTQIASSAMSERHTFLDIEFFHGRPVIVLDYKNFVTPEHDSVITVTYELNSITLLYKPLYVSGVFFACFVIYIISARFASTTDASKQDAASKKKHKSL